MDENFGLRAKNPSRKAVGLSKTTLQKGGEIL